MKKAKEMLGLNLDHYKTLCQTATLEFFVKV